MKNTYAVNVVGLGANWVGITGYQEAKMFCKYWRNHGFKVLMK